MEEPIKLNLSQIYKDTIADITASAGNWKRFLSYAAKFYEYSFENIVLSVLLKDLERPVKP